MAGDRLRAQLFALLAVLVLLWGYAAYLTGRDAVELARVRVLSGDLGQPTDALIRRLQVERRLTALVLAGAPAGRNEPLAALRARRADTDATVARLRDFTRSRDLRLVGAGTVRQRADDLVRMLGGLAALREAADAGELDRKQAISGYTELIDTGFGVYGAQWTSRETLLVERTRAFVALARAREMLAREDAVVAGILAAGRITQAERTALADLVAAQRFARAEAVAALPEPERARYQRLTDGNDMRTLRALEDRLVASARGGRTGTAGPADGSVADDPAGAREATGGDSTGGDSIGGEEAAGGSSRPVPPIAVQTWQAAVDPVLAGLRELVTSGVRDSVTRAAPSAVAVVVRLGLVGGLGLVAVVAVLFGAVRAAQGLRHRLERLREMAQNLADDGLSEAARRLRRGETVQAGDGWLAPAYGTDPVAQVGQAIDAVRRSAVRVLVEQAEAERHNRDLFLHLTRRNQVLLRRQLNLLDAMQRRQASAEELSDLFRVDHLTTRIRRNVEKLITAAGGVPARRWRRPVPLIDVVRAALAEVEDYPRVLVSAEWTGSLSGPAVNDVTHLLAELIENGLAYSPSTSAVRVSGEASHDGGRTVEVRDAGPGLDPEALAVTNTLLRDPPPLRPPGVGHGLYLVAMLARRWSITVELGPSPRAGTVALVRIPATLMFGSPDETADARTAELPRVPSGGPEVPATIPMNGRDADNPGSDPP